MAHIYCFGLILKRNEVFCQLQTWFMYVTTCVYWGELLHFGNCFLTLKFYFLDFCIKVGVWHFFIILILFHHPYFTKFRTKLSNPLLVFKLRFPRVNFIFTNINHFTVFIFLFLSFHYHFLYIHQTFLHVYFRKLA